MISVKEAKKLIADNIEALTPVRIPLAEARALVLAEDVYAAFDIPAFRQSSMDGYAIRFADYTSGQPMPVSAESAAGNTIEHALQNRTACRIFTGAPLPPGADTVVMQEKVRREGNLVNIEDLQLTKFQNTRAAGAEITSGSLALESRKIMTAAATGYLAAIGCTHISAYPLPVVTLIITGNEFQEAGVNPGYGKVFEANGAAISAALAAVGVSGVTIKFAGDDLAETSGLLAEALRLSDLVLLTGGVSVGDYDFVVPSAEQCGVKKIFHKIKQKPGKPLFFGMSGKKPVFGLPGNPASVLTCFYEYVLPAIGKLVQRDHSLRVRPARLKLPLSKPAGLTHFMKGVYNDDGVVEILTGQESFRLGSFAKANCLVVVDENISNMEAGEEIEIHLLPT